MGHKYEKRTVETMAFVGATCDRCNAHIPKLHEDDYFSTNLDGGLIVMADGWYGGLIDPIGEDPNWYRAILCNDCGRKLLDEFFPHVADQLSPEEVDKLMSQCWDEEAR